MIHDGVLASFQRRLQSGGAEGEEVTAESTHQSTNMTLTNDHSAALRETQGYERSLGCVRTHNRNITKIIEWIKTSYPDAYESMTRPLTTEEMNDQLLYYKGKRDFIYSNLNSDIIKAFIASSKVKATTEDGTVMHYGYDSLRKYHDAVLFGESRGKGVLPPTYRKEMKSFLNSLKKENQQKKKHGEVEENEADPITMPFYKAITKWCVERGYILLWFFVTLQWNLMARACSVSGLTWGSFSIGKDSIVIKYFDSKKDKEGSKCTPKNLYANPFNFMICCHTAAACYFAIFDTKFNNNRETVFANTNTKKTTASHCYLTSLHELFKEMGDTILQWVRPGHAKDHGIRKGAGMECTSGTTCPPPMVSVARRGEWSMGKVFDIYFLFAESGDYYCGRILAGLCSLSPTFDVLPPHFVCGMENSLVAQHLKENYPCLLKLSEKEGYGFMKSILLRIFASLIYHSDSLLEIAARTRSHPFLNIPVLQNQEALVELKKLVTIQPSDVIDAPTGIPPHVYQQKQISTLTTIVKRLDERQENLPKIIFDNVQEAIERNAFDNGNLTYGALQSLLKKQRDEVIREMQDQRSEERAMMRSLVEALNRSNGGSGGSYVIGPDFESNLQRSVDNNAAPTSTPDKTIHAWGGKLWHVPQNFGFPKNTFLRHAWTFWLKGMPNFKLIDGTNASIMPFRKIDSNFLPNDIRNVFQNGWRPILSKMQEAPNLPDGAIIDDSAQLSSEIIERSFLVAFEYLKSQYTYIFISDRFKKHNDWVVSTWSKNTKRSIVLEYGSEEDKENLPSETRMNKKRRRMR
jgi:hypothetical protein